MAGRARSAAHPETVSPAPIVNVVSDSTAPVTAILTAWRSVSPTRRKSGTFPARNWSVSDGHVSSVVAVDEHPQQLLGRAIRIPTVISDWHDFPFASLDSTFGNRDGPRLVPMEPAT